MLGESSSVGRWLGGRSTRSTARSLVPKQLSADARSALQAGSQACMVQTKCLGCRVPSMWLDLWPSRYVHVADVAWAGPWLHSAAADLGPTDELSTKSSSDYRIERGIYIYTNSMCLSSFHAPPAWQAQRSCDRVKDAVDASQATDPKRT